MTLRILISFALITSLLSTGCHSYTRYRPANVSPVAQSEAQSCFAECDARHLGDRANQGDYYSCVQVCPGVVQEDGPCDESMEVCEERKQLSAAKVFSNALLVGLTLLAVATVVVVATTDYEFPECDVPHC